MLIIKLIKHIRNQIYIESYLIHSRILKHSHDKLEVTSIIFWNRQLDFKLQYNSKLAISSKSLLEIINQHVSNLRFMSFKTTLEDEIKQQ